MTNHNTWLKFAMAALLVGMAVSGCKSSSNNPTPSNDAGVNDAGKAGAGGSTAGSGGKGGSGGSTAGTGGSTAGSGGSTAGSGGSTAGSGGTAGTDNDAGQGCVASSGCWQCAPTTPANFLNQCSSSASFVCAPYNNSSLGLTGGALPSPIP